MFSVKDDSLIFVTEGEDRRMKADCCRKRDGERNEMCVLFCEVESEIITFMFTFLLSV